ncbi:MAG: UDP-N-acetylmuramoyl-L-alanyl-D-glutamate--2,6-diaminopimelate ligase [Chloroflexi bacterium]|nr:UDP-N-acetylmuramoyl-L-alanyl-D-glutamate--2,6-diaminopimelate ligase [Chloroflexota bacterium]
MRLSTLVSALPAVLQRSPGDPDILGIEHDSRCVMPGALFVARRGGNTDGHRFIPNAIKRGAVAIVGEDSRTPTPPHLAYVQVPDSSEALAWLCAAYHDFPARKLVMIGVTGTDGKTTTCNLIHSVLLAAGLKAGMISTVNAVIGDVVLDTGLHTTTPDAPDVQRYLAQMAAAGMTHCVLETTSHGLAQHRVAACDFDFAVVTNITHEHLDFHGSLENYRAAKAKLFEGLAAAHKKPGVEKLALLNADDSSYEYLRARLSVPHASYGIAAPADVRATEITHTPDSTRFTVRSSGARPLTSDLHFQTSLIGLFNISNCLAAIAVGLNGLSLPPEAVQRGIASLKGVVGRMERIDLGQNFTAIVDFAHTPNGLQRALETARQLARNFTTGRVIVVFGSAGLRDAAKRRWMGEVAAELADLAVITAEDPRTESLEAIMAESAAGAEAKGGREGQTFWRIADRGEAIAFAVGLAAPGDVVMACGKAHEQSMCFGEIEYPWDDRVAMRAALSARLGLPGPAMPRLPTSAAQ